MSNPESPVDFLKRFLAGVRNSPNFSIRNYIAPIFVFGFIGFSILYKLLFVYIGPAEFGIKVKQIGLNAGVQKEVYNTGLHFIIPTIQAMEKLPRNIQILELTEFPRRYRGLRNIKIGRAVHIQTSDGFYVDVDVSILYKITDPYKVITTLGKKGIYENTILPKVEPALKRSLGQLTTEEFYNSILRVEKTIEAKDILSAEFAQNGLEVMHVLVRYFKYSNEIQKNIEDKKLKDQLVFKNKAEAHAASEGAILKKVIQEGEANVSILFEQGKAYQTKKNADKELYSRKKKANANLLVKLAEAKKTSLKNKALQMGGSDKLVGLAMAKVLKGLDTIILSSDGASGINPLNLKQTLRTFEVKN